VKEAGRAPVRLPTVRQLAAEIGVNPATVAKAAGRLARLGLLTVRHGAGIYVVKAETGSPAPVVQAEIEEKDRSQSIRDLIAGDILAGRLAPGSMLPTAKELCSTYRANHRTVRRALRELAQTSAVVPHGRGFRVLSARAEAPGATITLLTPTGHLPNLNATYSRASELWRTLERQCLRLKLRLEWCPHWHVLEGRYRAGIRRGTLGYILWVTSGMPTERLTTLIRTVARSGKPIAVLDQHDPRGIARLSPWPSQVCVFSLTSNHAAGRAVGATLLGLGHRRAAFFSAHTAAQWGAERLAGVREALSPGKSSDTVSAYCLPPQDDWSTVHELVARDPQYRRLLTAIDDMRRKLNPDLRDDLELDPQIEQLMRAQYLSRAMMPLFATAIADPGITAWIAENDELGYAVLDALERRGISAGRDISVVGFDDLAPSFSYQLTSYDFNVSAAVVALVDFVVGGGRKPPGSRGEGGWVEVPGLLVERSSCGPCRRPLRARAAQTRPAG